MQVNKVYIEKVKLKDLKSFINSHKYRSFQTKPISTNRVESYLANPRRKMDKYVLYLALKNNELVGFRTILQDQLLVNSVIYSFGWFSGNWVNPNFRRNGISTLLFNEVKADWYSQLLYTNYAPASKALYDKSNDFTLLINKNGVRIYIKPILYQLLKDRFPILNKIKWLVFTFEKIIEILFWPKTYYARSKGLNYLKNIETHSSLNADILRFLNTKVNSIFSRKSIEYQWIENYPWVKNEGDIIVYPFSITANKLISQYLIIRDIDGEISAIAMVKNIDGKVTVPILISDKKNSSKILNAILGFAYKTDAKIITVFNPELVNHLTQIKFAGLFKKSMNQKYFIMNDFYKKLNIDTVDIKVQDGDGDVIFT